MNFSFKVQNVMCGGCASNIEKGLKEHDAISDVQVDIESGEVRVSASEDVSEWAKNKCTEIGYPLAEAVALDPMAAFKAGAMGD